MNNKKNIAIGALVVLTVCFAYFAAIKKLVIQPLQTNLCPVCQNIGALPGPDIMSPYISVNNLKIFTSRTAMQQGTTTLCSIKGPAATSSILAIGFKIDIGTSTASTIAAATSTTAYATSSAQTIFKTVTVPANGDRSYHWQSAGNGVEDNIIGPSQYLLIRTEGAGLSGYRYTGTCTAIFGDL